MLVTEIYNGQGLGNQLWCYVVTRVIAMDHRYDFGIMNPERFKCNDFMDIDFGRPVTGGSGPEGGPPITLPEGIKHYYKERRLTRPYDNADISTHDDNLVHAPDSTKIDGNMQDEQYIVHRKHEIQEWLKVKGEYECYDYSSDDICVINFRGGEYVHVPDVFVPKSYYAHAVGHMRKINPRFTFVVITDDVVTARKFFPEFEVHHFNIAEDYVVIKNAHYLILANSSFAWFPAWLSEKLKFCIAPRYWWGHNRSDGYWACDYNITSGWHYQDREGKLPDYDSCLKELREYKEQHHTHYYPTKITKNFVVVSNYNNDIGWVPERTDNYLIYDRGEHDVLPYTVDPKKVVKPPNVGYNIYDYLTFIIDHYERLPDRTIFTKGNVFPRHVTKAFFDGISNNDAFTPIEDPRMHNPKMPSAFFSSDGGFNEINNSWYLNHHPVKYFSNYNDFLKFCFKDPVIPDYVRFPPGANYIVPKENILKYPRIFYENLKIFVSHTPLPGEAHIIERALYTIWTCNFELSEAMRKPIADDFVAILPKRKFNTLKQAIDVVRTPITKVEFVEILKKRLPEPIQTAGYKSILRAKAAAKKILALKNQPLSLKGLAKKVRFSQKSLSTVQIAEYRKKIRIYDAFYFFNELEVLEIRLNIFDPYVDYFVIVEAAETFSGLPKKLVFEENKERFNKFEKKIIYYVTKDTPADEDDLRKRLYDKKLSALDREITLNALTSDNIPKGEAHWLKEFYQKESLKKALVHLSDNDFCFVSDVDEMWNPEAKIDYSKNDLFKYKQVAYYYYLNNRSNDNWTTGWTGTVATKYKNIKHSCLNHLRTHTKNKYTVINNGGWHFTFQGGAERMKKKLESYGHQEFNTHEIKSQLENALLENRDYRGRNLKFWLDESELPDYVIENKTKYSHLFR